MKRRDFFRTMLASTFAWGCTGDSRSEVSEVTPPQRSETSDLVEVKNLASRLKTELSTKGGERFGDFCGVSHIHGAYAFTENDFLNEGADRLLELGCESIKLSTLRASEAYPFHSQWQPAWSESSFSAVQSPYFRTLFDKPFKTIVLWAYSGGRGEHYWKSGPITAQELEDEALQFDRLTTYLLETYRGSDKTFILSHWEGDWAIRGHTEAERDPSPEAFEGMRNWLAARQHGVDRARERFGDLDTFGCRVFHAAEVNLVKRCLPTFGGRPGVATEILPHVPLDLVSYSAYDSQLNPGEFRSTLQLLADRLAAKDGVDQRFGGRPGRIFVGEYGFPENHPDAKRILLPMVENVLRVSTEFGCHWTFFWQLYCNEVLRIPVKTNADCRGFGLIRPDGAQTEVCRLFRELWTT